MKTGLAVALCVGLAAWTAPALAYRWLPSHGRSCARVCIDAEMSPVVSGIYKNGHPYSVCRAAAGGEGKRAGYNLEPDWANACWVGYGGREQRIGRYDCLCDR